MLPPPLMRRQKVVVVAIANFQPPFPELLDPSVLFLPFSVGDRMCIISTTDNWCFGSLESNMDLFGVFPSNYVEAVDTSMINNCMQKRASTSEFFFEEEAESLAIEVSETLKSWWQHLKANYASGVDNKSLPVERGFEFYEKEMKELMLVRKKILEGNIPTEELRELRQECARTVDMVTHWMGLGMHIRDDKFKILRIDKLSVVQAYREHEKAYSRILKNGTGSAKHATALVLAMNPIDFKLHFDCEVTLCLWNSGSTSAMTEHITFKWNAAVRKFDHETLSCMFIGLTEAELLDEKLELAVSVAITAPIDIAILTRNGKYSLPNQFPTAQRYRQRLASGRTAVHHISNKEKREMRLSLAVEKTLELSKYHRSSDKQGELFIEFSLQKLRGASLEDIESCHPEVFADVEPVPLQKMVPENVQAMLEEERNEVFLKLGPSDLHGGKYSGEKNVEAVLKVFDDEGTPYLSCFEVITPDGVETHDEYRSLVSVLNDRPVFDELVKITLPERPMKDLHLRVTYSHRRLQDKSPEKAPFALSYLKLFSHGVLQRSCASDELLVYKADKFQEKNMSYLWQCSTRAEQKNSPGTKAGPASSSFTLNERNSLQYTTTVLSAAHTMDSKMLYVMRFHKNKDAVEKMSALVAAKDPNSQLEIVKFFGPFMDAAIGHLGSRDEATDRVLVDAMAHAIGVCADRGYENVMEDYLEVFHSPTAYLALTEAFVRYLESGGRRTSDSGCEPALKVLKSTGYLTRLLVKSKECRDGLGPPEPVYADTLRPCLLRVVAKLKEVILDGATDKKCKNCALRNLTTVISPVIDSGVVEPVELAAQILELFLDLSSDIVILQKIDFMGQVVQTDLFQDPESLALLFSPFLDELSRHLHYGRSERAHDALDEIILASQVLADVIETLFPFSQLESVYRTGDDAQMQEIVLKTTKAVVHTATRLAPSLEHARPVQALYLALLDMFHTQMFIDCLAQERDERRVVRLLSDMLGLIGKLVELPPFPQEWYQLKYLQDRLFLKHLRYVNAYMHTRTRQFHPELCIQFFRTTGSMMRRIVPYEDTSIYSVENRRVREKLATVMRSAWFTLAPEQKPLLLDGVVGEFMQVLLVDDYHIRTVLIPMIVDMRMVDPDSKRFMNEFIVHLDVAVDHGSGDVHFKEQLKNQLMLYCIENDDPKKYDCQLLEFIERIDHLIELQFNLRHVRNDSECLQSAKFCLDQLIKFYKEIEINELMIQYLDNLYRTHLSSNNIVEAAFTLQDFSKMLEWSPADVPQYIVARKLHRCKDTQLELKEMLHLEMERHFTESQHWEKAIEVLKVLVPIYETTLYDYDKLANALHRMASLYQLINKDVRTESFYFLVGFYGQGFPEYLVNKKFVFRGEPLEMLLQFKEKLMANFFGAVSVEHSGDCEELTHSEGKHIQIIPIHPVQSDQDARSKNVKALLLWYSKHHSVFEFEFQRPERRNDTKWTRVDANDGTRTWIRKKTITVSHKLPGSLNFSPVVHERDLEPMNPVQVAIQKIEEINENMIDTAELVHNNYSQYVGTLGGWIRGVLQADVGGGIKNYESFFSEEILALATDSELKQIERLKRVIVRNVSVLEACLFVHAQAHHLIHQSFHAALVDAFYEYRKNVESRYGPCPTALPPDASIHLPASGNLESKALNPNNTHFPNTSSNLSLDDVDGRQNVLFRTVPGAATILRSKSKITSTPQKPTITHHDPGVESRKLEFIQALREFKCRSDASPEPRNVAQDFEALNNQHDMTSDHDQLDNGDADLIPVPPHSPPPLPPRHFQQNGRIDSP